jgi:hypothetical protein
VADELVSRESSNSGVDIDAMQDSLAAALVPQNVPGGHSTGIADLADQG